MGYAYRYRRGVCDSILLAANELNWTMVAYYVGIHTWKLGLQLVPAFFQVLE